MSWLRDPYRPRGTSYWGYRARYAVFVHAALVVPLLLGSAYVLRLASPGAWTWLTATTHGWIAIGLYLTAGAAFRVQPFDEDRVSVPFSQDRDLANLMLVFLPAYFVLDAVLGLALLARFAKRAPEVDPWREPDDGGGPRERAERVRE